MQRIREHVEAMKGELQELLRAKEIIDAVEPVKAESLLAGKGVAEAEEGGISSTKK